MLRRARPARRLAALLAAASPLVLALTSTVHAQAPPPADDLQLPPDAAPPPPARPLPPPPSPPPAAGPEAPAPATERPRWSLAPIRWGGRAGFEYRRATNAGQPTQSSFIEDVTVGATTFIWQPWFVQLAGSIGLVANQVDNGGSSGDSTGATGNFSLSVFPTSRFPFLLSYDRGDSRTSGDFFGLDYRSERWGLRQSYRTRDGQTSAALTADRSTLDSDNLGKDRVDALGAEFSTAWARQSLSVSASASENTRSIDDGSTRLSLFGAQHSYRPDINFTADTLATVTRSDLRLRLQGAALERQVNEFRQYSTFATWRPEDDHPLQLIGTLRAFDSRTTQLGTTTADLLTIGGTLAANYRFNERLSAFGALNASQIDSAGVTRAFYNETAGVNYAFLPRQLLGSTYAANASVSGGYSHGDEIESQTQAAAQFGHSLTRQLAGSRTSSLALTAGQSFGVVHEDQRGSTRSLQHSLGVSWRYTGLDAGSGFASLSVGDSRSYGAVESSFSLANAQLSGQFQTNQYSNWSANLTAQYTQQSSSALSLDTGALLLPGSTRSNNTTVSGSLAYQHSRAFSVPRLRFTSQLNAYNNNYSRAAGDPNAPPQYVSWTFENRLDWFIGRLQARVGLRVAEIDGKENALLYFRVNRNFGS